MRALMLPVRSPPDAIDLCGTGGDNRHTLNVSTATAFVVSACGVTVAKHGNRAVSSRSGAADILAALGIDPDPDPSLQEHRLETEGLAFLHAPRHHPALRHAAPARAALGTRTILNLAGPLCNPANAPRQLIGVYDPRWLLPMAETLKALGTERAWLVHGDGLDELTLSAETQIVALENGAIRRFTVTPEDAGLPRAPIAAITGADPAHNARALIRLLEGEPGPYRDIVLLNAAAALVIAAAAASLHEAARNAAEAIDSGAALAKLQASKARGVAPRTPSKASL
jgi:anthranilate phosphoribosyltransferase